jgi:hypothetical protein
VVLLNTQPYSYKILLVHNIRKVRKVYDVPPVAYVPYVAYYITLVTIPRYIALSALSWTVPILTN